MNECDGQNGHPDTGDRSGIAGGPIAAGGPVQRDAGVGIPGRVDPLICPYCGKPLVEMRVWIRYDTVGGDPGSGRSAWVCECSGRSEQGVELAGFERVGPYRLARDNKRPLPVPGEG